MTKESYLNPPPPPSLFFLDWPLTGNDLPSSHWLRGTNWRFVSGGTDPDRESKALRQTTSRRSVLAQPFWPIPQSGNRQRHADHLSTGWMTPPAFLPLLHCRLPPLLPRSYFPALLNRPSPHSQTVNVQGASLSSDSMCSAMIRLGQSLALS